MVSSIQREIFFPGRLVTARPTRKRRARGITNQRKSSPGNPSMVQADSDSGATPRREFRAFKNPLIMARPILWRSRKTRTTIHPVARTGITVAIPARNGLSVLRTRGCLMSRGRPMGSIGSSVIVRRENEHGVRHLTTLGFSPDGSQCSC